MSDHYHRWVEYTDELFKNDILKKKSLPPYLVNLYGLMILKKLNRDDLYKVRREQHSLYKIVVNVRLLQNLQNWFESSRYSYQEIEDTCRQLFEIIYADIQNALKHLPSPMPFSYDPICEKLRLDVRELLFLEGAFKHEILQIYWYVWKSLFTRPQLRNEELDFAEKTARKGANASSWQFAYMFQLFLSGRVEESLALLKNIGSNYLSYLLLFMDYYFAGKNWNGFTKLAQFLIEHIKDYLDTISYSLKQKFFYSIDTVFHQFAKETGRYDLYEQLLIAMYPFATRELSYFYFERKEYGKLIEFAQLSNFGYLSSDILRTIQKEEPQYLLPYYHRKVQMAIDQKNRQSYKEAVRHLKKLRTIYKKLKKEEKWEVYFEQLLHETKRLRAFQEECQRGKLINVENETA
ncbi:hypothetical protein LIZ76_12520 [Caldibacillus sp. 210928-DFI.2.22]|uniref:hypothetical protein n=1 Tax=unclassified Caldibacillus TaxID=2641266 RepID=UPI001D09021E|nr:MULTISPECIES: hypothetical protein [unclassified Caldibacillus]MCB7070790.1 hypothetical protein [Caldibacillus sp. 210928-DFI.2.22]MCB7074289.1 hypothetical protein [Caldibacillus sp. 210928-DFI.2.18]